MTCVRAWDGDDGADMALRSILMIDDDRMQFRLVQQLFSQFRGERFELEWAQDYESGLERLLSGRFSACLLDYQLGPRDGLELIRQAVRLGCVTPIVFVTAETSAAVDQQALDAGALDYLVKGEISVASLERSLRYAFKLAATLAELRRLATRDPLTGLWNRREFDRVLAEEVERARRFGRRLTLISCDLDFFKAINDTHGHPAGDAVLVEVARRLQAEARGVDRVARVGGEELAVLVLETELAGGVALAERLLRAIRSRPVTVADGVEVGVTASAGVAALPEHGGTSEALVAAADRALYVAKNAGRDRVMSA